MGLCRVDTDRLRGLASRLGDVAVVLDDAAPAADVLVLNGHGDAASVVAGTLTASTAWATEWVASLRLRTDLVESGRDFFATPAWTTPELHRRAQIQAVMATHVPSPVSLDGGVGIESADLAVALASLTAASSPDEVRRFFSETDAALASALAVAHADVVGPLGGAPHALRFMANRILLDRTIASLRLDLERAAGMGWLDLAIQLAVLDRIAERHPALLTFDWEAGRIVEWIGPHDAAHVAVYVPGAMVSRVDYADLSGDLGVLTDLDRAAGDLALVAALMYSPPPTIVHGAFGSYADSGGRELVSLTAGLELDGRHISLVGHSYGSVVIGEALHQGLAEALPPDFDIVVLGSPGVRADHVSDLGVEPQRFWAALLPGDEIAAALHPSELLRRAACASSGLGAVVEACGPSTRLIHGVNPAHPTFGGRSFPVSDEGRGGHSDYLAVSTEDGVVVPSIVVADLVSILVGRRPGAT